MDYHQQGHQNPHHHHHHHESYTLQCSNENSLTNVSEISASSNNVNTNDSLGLNEVTLPPQSAQQNEQIPSSQIMMEDIVNERIISKTTEMELPIKRKKGRPRKHPIVKIDNSTSTVTTQPLKVPVAVNQTENENAINLNNEIFYENFDDNICISVVEIVDDSQNSGNETIDLGNFVENNSQMKSSNSTIIKQPDETIYKSKSDSHLNEIPLGSSVAEQIKINSTDAANKANQKESILNAIDEDSYSSSNTGLTSPDILHIQTNLNARTYQNRRKYFVAGDDNKIPENQIEIDHNSDKEEFLIANQSECRRSQRRKIMKYDVKDLFKKGKRNKKIDIRDLISQQTASMLSQNSNKPNDGYETVRNNSFDSQQHVLVNFPNNESPFNNTLIDSTILNSSSGNEVSLQGNDKSFKVMKKVSEIFKKAKPVKKNSETTSRRGRKRQVKPDVYKQNEEENYEGNGIFSRLSTSTIDLHNSHNNDEEQSPQLIEIQSRKPRTSRAICSSPSELCNQPKLFFLKNFQSLVDGTLPNKSTASLLQGENHSQTTMKDGLVSISNSTPTFPLIKNRNENLNSLDSTEESHNTTRSSIESFLFDDTDTSEDGFSRRGSNSSSSSSSTSVSNLMEASRNAFNICSREDNQTIEAMDMIAEELKDIGNDIDEAEDSLRYALERQEEEDLRNDNGIPETVVSVGKSSDQVIVIDHENPVDSEENSPMLHGESNEITPSQSKSLSDTVVVSCELDKKDDKDSNRRNPSPKPSSSLHHDSLDSRGKLEEQPNHECSSLTMKFDIEENKNLSDHKIEESTVMEMEISGKEKEKVQYENTKENSSKEIVNCFENTPLEKIPDQSNNQIDAMKSTVEDSQVEKEVRECKADRKEKTNSTNENPKIAKAKSRDKKKKTSTVYEDLDLNSSKILYKNPSFEEAIENNSIQSVQNLKEKTEENSRDSEKVKNKSRNKFDNKSDRNPLPKLKDKSFEEFFATSSLSREEIDLKSYVHHETIKPRMESKSSRLLDDLFERHRRKTSSNSPFVNSKEKSESPVYDISKRRQSPTHQKKKKEWTLMESTVNYHRKEDSSPELVTESKKNNVFEDKKDFEEKAVFTEEKSEVENLSEKDADILASISVLYSDICDPKSTKEKENTFMNVDSDAMKNKATENQQLSGSDSLVTDRENTTQKIPSSEIYEFFQQTENTKNEIETMVSSITSPKKHQQADLSPITVTTPSQNAISDSKISEKSKHFATDKIPVPISCIEATEGEEEEKINYPLNVTASETERNFLFDYCTEKVDDDIQTEIKQKEKPKNKSKSALKLKRQLRKLHDDCFKESEEFRRRLISEGFGDVLLELTRGTESEIKSHTFQSKAALKDYSFQENINLIETPKSSPNSDNSKNSGQTATEEMNNSIRRSNRIKTISQAKHQSVGVGLVKNKMSYLLKDDDRILDQEVSKINQNYIDLEAENAKFLKDMEERLSQFMIIKENEYKCERIISREARRMTCDCFLTREEEDRGELGCGEDCLNRLLMIECGPKCNVGDRCTNRRFQRSLNAPCKVFRTEKKGFGLMADSNILPGQFIMEYVGEVVNTKQFEKRADVYSQDKNKHYYFMALRSDAIIDATQKGNISRFINHSCDPNAETQKWTVNGELRIGFFSKKFILSGEEITFDYQFQRYGREAQKCFCESENCRGWIGEEPVSDEEFEDDIEISGSDESGDGGKENDLKKVKRRVVDDLSLSEEEMDWEDESPRFKKSIKSAAKQRRRRMKKVKGKPDFGAAESNFISDIDLDEDIEFLVRTGLKNRAHTLRLSRLMVRAKNFESRMNLLEILRKGEAPCKRLFLDYHGLRLIHGWMIEMDTNDVESDFEFRHQLVETLETLPIPNKTMLKESKVFQIIESWADEKSTDQEEKQENQQQQLQHEQQKEDSNLEQQQQPQQEQQKEDSNLEQNSPRDISELVTQDVTMSKSSAEEEEKKKETLEKVKHPLQDEIIRISKRLIAIWEELPEIFRIPKRERIEQMKEHEREADLQYKALGLADDENEYLQSRLNKERFGVKKVHKRVWDSTEKKYVNSYEFDLDPNLSKEQRRQIFEARVAKYEEKRRVEEKNREFETKCKFFGLDMNKATFKDLPFCVNSTTGQWYTKDRRPIETPPSHTHIQLPMKRKSTDPLDYILPPGIQDLPPLWKFAIDPRGRIYYYHVKIRIPQWEPPIKIAPLDNGEPQPSTSSVVTGEENQEAKETTAVSNSPPTKEADGKSETEDKNENEDDCDADDDCNDSDNDNDSNADDADDDDDDDDDDDGGEDDDNGSEDNEENDCDNGIGTESDITKLPQSDDKATESEQKETEIQENQETPTVNQDVKVGGKRIRFRLLVQERPISPRREEDRLYNQMELKKYKENKEKIRRRKEEIKRRKAELKKNLDAEIANLLSNTTESNCSTKDEQTPLPIQDYLISSDEDDKSDCDSPLINKFVKGDKIVDELDALKKEKPLKRPLPIIDKNAKKKFSEDLIKNVIYGNGIKNKNKERKEPDLKLTSVSLPLPHHSVSSSSSKGTPIKLKASQSRKAKDKFRADIAGIIVQHLQPYRKSSCTVGQITSNEDFKHLARKLTHFVMVKELKHCESTGQTLVVTESVKIKSREFIKKYMAKYGKTYVRPHNDPEFKDIPR